MTEDINTEDRAAIKEHKTMIFATLRWVPSSGIDVVGVVLVACFIAMTALLLSVSTLFHVPRGGFVSFAVGRYKTRVTTPFADHRPTHVAGGHWHWRAP